MSVSFQDGQAEVVWSDPAYQQIISVVQQMMCRHGGGNSISGTYNKADRISGGNVFKDNPEPGEICDEFAQVLVDKGFFSIEDVNVAFSDFPVYQQGKVVLFHGLKHGVEVSQVVDPRLRICSGSRGIQFDAVNVG